MMNLITYAIDWSNFWTRENWVQIMDMIRDFFNQPVPIIGCTVFSLLVFILTIISKTTFGKRNLLKLKKGYAELVGAFDNLKKESAENEKNLRDFYETQLNVAQVQLQEAKNLIQIIASNTHNKKVQEALQNYNSQIEIVKTNYDEFLKHREEQIKAQVESEYKEKYQESIDNLKDAYNQLKEQLDKLLLEKEEPVVVEPVEVKEHGEQ